MVSSLSSQLSSVRSSGRDLVDRVDVQTESSILCGAKDLLLAFSTSTEERSSLLCTPGTSGLTANRIVDEDEGRDQKGGPF